MSRAAVRERPRGGGRVRVPFRIDAAGKPEEIDLRTHPDLLHEVDQDQVEILFVLGPDHCVIDPLIGDILDRIAGALRLPEASNRFTLIFLV